VSSKTKRNAEELQDALREQHGRMKNMVAFTQLHIKDPVLVAKVEACAKGIKDTIQYIDSKLTPQGG